MKILPVVGRELIAASRNRQIYRTRFFAAVAAVVAMAWVVLFGSGGAGFNLLGKTLFQYLACSTWAFCLLGGMLTADSISFEKREGTLGLLFLTSLRGHDVIFGKLTATGLGAIYAILGLLPVLSMALLLGSIQSVDVLRVGIVWLNTLFVSMTLGIAVSTISVNSRRAAFGVLTIILGMVFLPYAIAFWQADINGSGIFRIGPEFILFSPFRALELALQAAGKAGRTTLWLEPDFQTSLILPHVFAWAAAAISSLLLPSLSRDRAKSRLQQIVEKSADKWSYGEGSRRLRRRAELLDRNAYLWLSARHQKKRGYVWFFLASMALIWIVAGYNYPIFILSWSICFALFMGIHGGLKIWWTAEVCTQLTEDKRSGALELLLTTPLGVDDIIKGHRLALFRMFARPIGTLLLLEAVLFLVLLKSPHTQTGDYKLIWLSIPGGVALLLVDAWALRWVGLQNSLAGKSAQHAINRTAWQLLLLPSLILIAMGMAVASINRLSFGVDWNESLIMLTVWLGLGISTDLFHGLRAKVAFQRGFRPTAAGDRESTETEMDETARNPVQPDPTPKVWWRRHRYKLAAGLLVAGVFLACFIHQQWWSWKAEKLLATLRARGIATNPEEWEKIRPYRGSHTNAYSELSIAATIAGPIRNSIEDIDALFRARPELKKHLELATAGSGPVSYGPEHADPQLGEWHASYWSLNGLMQLSAVKAMQSGNTSEAVTQLLRYIRLGELLSRLPSGGGMAVHTFNDVLNNSLRHLQELFTQSQLDSETLTRIEKAIPELDKPHLVERWLQDDLYRFIRITENPSLLDRYFMGPRGGAGPGTEMKVAFRAMKLSGFADKAYFQSLKAWETALWAASGDWSRLLKTPMSRPARQFNLLQSLGMESNPQPFFFNLPAALATQLRATRIALAVEQFRLKHNRLPNTLWELEPQVSPEFLKDPVTGTSMRIRLTHPGYIIERIEIAESDDSNNNSRRFQNPDSFKVGR